jgi:FtsP/CotA-like multicopper oxidase with cupredoxin domain
LALLGPRSPHPQVAPEPVRPNDNRAAAGQLTDGVLTINLEMREALWRPEADDGPSIPVYAFAEPGQPATLPGPMIRVPVGTEVAATVHNRLTRPARVVGLFSRATASPEPPIPPGERREFRFRADVPGTYFYFATIPPIPPAPANNGREASLIGALVIDSAGAPKPPRDRVLVLHGFYDTLSALGTRSDASHDALGNEFVNRAFWPVVGVNGKSWPHTERLEYSEGDTVQLRVINAGPFPHPMHLHGFHFSVDARGNVRRDTVYSPATRRVVVTEQMLRGSTMSMRWHADRPGNWLFHCHLITHIVAELRLPGSPHPAGHANHAESGMAGLVTAIRVRPTQRTAPVATVEPRRRLRVFVNERPGVYDARPGLSYVLQEGNRPPTLDSLSVPSSTLYLRQHEPTEITILNRTRQATTIHWHGIELESYYDGVADWSGWDNRIARPIAAGDSFVVRVTPPRAGTFIYHTHLDESVQLASGLFGALIVLPPGATPDTTDRVFLVGMGGPDDSAVPVINGSPSPPAVELRAGVAHRFRLINISPSEPRLFELISGDAPARWRAVAKDGADLSAHYATEQPARVQVTAGATYDFIVLQAQPGSLSLRITGSNSVATRSAFRAAAEAGDRVPPLVVTIPVIVR